MALGFLAYGLLTLANDVGHTRGACCARIHHNYYPSIEFSSLWLALAGVFAINTYRKVVFVGSQVRVSWLGGLIGVRSPLEEVAVSEAEVGLKDGSNLAVLKLRVRWLKVTISSQLDGYEQLRSSLREVGEF